MATSILKELDKYFPTVISNLILDFSNDRNDKFDEVLKDYNNMMKKSFESANNNEEQYSQSQMLSYTRGFFILREIKLAFLVKNDYINYCNFTNRKTLIKYDSLNENKVVVGSIIRCKIRPFDGGSVLSGYISFDDFIIITRITQTRYYYKFIEPTSTQYNIIVYRLDKLKDNTPEKYMLKKTLINLAHCHTSPGCILLSKKIFNKAQRICISLD